MGFAQHTTILVFLALTACSDDSTPSSAPDAGGPGAGGRGIDAGGGRPSSTGGRGNADGGVGATDASAGGTTSDGAIPDASAPEAAAPDATTTLDGGAVDARGGTITGPGGASIVVPPGAVTGIVTLAIAEGAAGAPALPAGLVAIGPILAYTPHGTTFAKPVTVRVPFDGTALPEGGTPLLLKAEPGGGFAKIDAQRDGDALTAEVSDFSWFVVARDGSRGHLTVAIGAERGVQGDHVHVGPAGSVYVFGASSADLDGNHPNAPRSLCYVAKLTTTLSFEWVRQYGGCFGTAKVGPTGNLHFAIDPEDNLLEIQLMSLNPSGNARAGFPITTAVSPTTIETDTQDDLVILGYVPTAYYYTSQASIGVFNSSGQATTPFGLVNFGAQANYNSFPQGLAVNAAGTFLLVTSFDRTTTNYAGSVLQHFATNGSAVAGFPIVDFQHPSTMLTALPGTSDVVVLGTEYQQSTSVLRRYHDNGTLAGSPVTLETGSTPLTDLTGLVADPAGNLFVMAKGTTTSGTTQWLLSYTEAGALRSGYPLQIATKFSASDPTPWAPRGFTVDETGNAYVVGLHNDATSKLAQLVIERLPVP